MRLFSILVCILLVSGCSKRSLEEQSPAGSSSVTKDQAVSIAITASRSISGGSVAMVAPTGSMAPVIDSRSVLLLEKYVGQQLSVGDIVLFDRGDVSSVCHRIVEIGPDSFYVSGDNNKWPDGWFKLSAVKHRVDGIIYTQRQ